MDNKREQLLNKVVKAARDHYGSTTQLIHAAEEAGEFIQAVLKLTRHAKFRHGSLPPSELQEMVEHLAEELTDCRMMLREVEFGLRLEKRCARWEKIKGLRTLARIKAGK